TLSSSLTSPAAGETLSVVISGVPAGAVLSAGTDNGDGTWTLSAAQLSGLTITPPADFSGTLNLSVTATSSVNGTQASHTEALTVTVASEADAPNLALQAAYGPEDQPIGLTIAAQLVDTDGSETLAITVAGVPTGAVLSAGTDNGDGSWTLSAAQLSGLTITPPRDYSGTFTLSVTARSAEANGDSASTSLDLPVTVTGVADTPLLTVSASSGTSDTAIPLHLSAVSQDIDLSETVSVQIAGVPVGARLSHGLLTSSTGGFSVWTVSADQLADLTITPPLHYNGVIDLTVRAIATEADGNSAASAAVHVPVTVTGSGSGGISAGVALNLGVVAGVEDTPVALNLLGSLTALLGSATIDSVVVTGVGNAALSAGVKLADGSYLLTPAQLAGLTLIPPHDLSGDYSLSATVNLGGSRLGASVSATLGVHVVGVADAPTLTVSGSAGAYASAIPLTITGALTDTSGSETLHYIIGVAVGAHLSAGIDNGDGTWTVLPSQIAGLTVTPPYGFSGSLPVTVTAVSQEVNGDTAYAQASLTVDVAAPVLVPPPAIIGTEDVGINIGGALLSLNLGVIAKVGITDLPPGATLSSGSLVNINANDISADLLSGLTLHLPAHYSGDFQIRAGVTLLGGLITLDQPLTVHVDPVADQPTLTVGATIAGTEDQPIPLGISGSLVDLDGSETLSFTVAGVPAGGRLTAGTANPLTGTWTLTAADLNGLAILPPPDFSGTISLTIGAVASELLGGQAVTVKPVTITIAPVTDTPVLTLPAATGNEDSAIPLTIGVATGDIDGSETITGLRISGLPAGATLNHGTSLGNGTYALTSADLVGLTMTPPANYAGTLSLTVTATAKDGTATPASASGSLAVTVKPVADVPLLTVSDCSGHQGHDVTLTIGAALRDTDGSEVLSVTIAGLPAGASLSAGLNNGDGSWTLTAAQLAGLKLHTASGFSGDLHLTVTAHALDGDTQASQTVPLTVTIAAQADAPNLSVLNAAGIEDQPIALTLSSSLNTPVAGETLSVVISGVPNGATLSAGVNNGNGTWTLSAAQLSGLTITPPADFSGTLNLSVTATSSVNGTQASQTAFLTVTVAPQADTPTLSVVDVVGVEDHSIALTLSSSLTHPVAGEVLSIVISGVPSGATLSAGTNNGDGSWTLSPAQLAGLALTPPANFSGSLDLTVTATASVNGTQAGYTETLTVTVGAVADAPSLALLPAYGREDQPIGLTIAAHLTDIDGSETLSVTIAGVPTGATLSAGIHNADGTWTLSAAQLSGLTITPPRDFSGTFTLSVTGRSVEANGDGAVTSLSLPVTVTGVADTPLLTAAASTGVADTAIPLHLSAVSRDIDLSETVSVQISGIPSGARLSQGVLTASAGGFTVWTVGADQLANLTITPPCHYTGVMDLTVRAVATEADGNSAASAAVHVPVTVTGSGSGGISAGVALNLGVVAGVEDTPVALNLLGSLTALLGSATIDSVVVTGVGNAALSAGVKLADGSYLLTPAQLAGLTLIPPHDLSGDYSLSATVNLGGSRLGASVSATLGVHVVGVADAPTLTVSGSAGAYASAIPLNIAGALTDTSGTEHLHYIIGVATGAHLSAGIDNGNGSWTVLPSQIAGLTVTPPYGFSGSLPVTVTAVSQEANGAVASIQKALTVSVAAPTAALLATLASLVAVNGTEDVGINIGQTLLSLNLGSIANVSLTGVPAGATLTSGGVVVSAGNINASLLSGLTLNMPANYSGDFQLGATVKLVGGLVTINKTLAVHVTPVADLPTLTVGATINGTEDQPIPLGISGTLLDLDGSESLSFTVAGVPAGGRLSAGHVNPLTGTWTLTAAELSGLAILPPPDFSGTISLTVGAVASELLGAVGVTVKPVTVTIAPVTDTPLLALPAAIGAEDSPIALAIGIATGDIDGSETITGLQISGLPAGATLNHGTSLGNGTYALTSADLVGLTMTPPANYAGTLSLTVTATAKDGTAAPASASGSLAVTVKPVADVPLLTVADCSGHQGHDVALTIGAALRDTDGSEVLSVTIAGLPAGASLSAGLNNGDGSWTLTAAQLAGLKLHTASGFSGDLHLTVTAHALDGSIGPCNQSLAEASASLTVHVQPELQLPHLSLPGLTVLEHGSALLDIGVGLAGLDLGATVNLTVAGLPVGASLSAGIHNQDGSWTLHADQLLGLRLTPPADSLDDFTLTVTASAEVAGLAAVQTTGSLHVTVLPDLGDSLALGLGTGVAIAPSLSLSVLGTQLVTGATVSLEGGFHDGDLLTLGGLRTETDASGHLVIAGTGIQVTGGGYDASSHTLTLSGQASASVYESVLKAIRLDPSDDCGSRSVTVDLLDGAGHAIDLAHQAITLDVGVAGSVTSTVLSGTTGLLDHALDGVSGALGGLSLEADLLAALPSDGTHTTPLDDPLHHNATTNAYA
ncbi:hypothetical protein QO018_006323, partial [Azospirillum picis]|nr:hypothetical protein [Azospirillum picis]